MDRLEQIQIQISPNLKKEQFSNLIRHYNIIIENQKTDNFDTIDIDRKKLKELLTKK